MKTKIIMTTWFDMDVAGNGYYVCVRGIGSVMWTGARWYVCESKKIRPHCDGIVGYPISYLTGI